MITLVATAKNAVNDTLAARVDAGSGANGTMEIRTSGGSTLLATIDLLNPAFGASSGGVSTLLGVPLLSTAAVATGTAAVFYVKDTDGVLVYSGSVGLPGSGADAIIDDANISTGDTVALTSHTLAPAP